ncbi:MAG: MlaE family ABC transporter permease [Verrucomicrobiales bacterium]
MIRKLGKACISIAHGIGAVMFLAGDTFRSLNPVSIRWRLTLSQIAEIGIRSQPVVLVTGAFTGAVFAAQTYFQFAKVSMESAVGAVVAVAMCRELGPVLAGLMVAGRVGAAMSAEIGTMKVTEQIDALRSLGVHPIDYLVVPRVLAMLISMPLLVGECIFIGIAASYYVSVNVMDISGTYYIAHMLTFTMATDVFMGLIKALVFGMIIVFVSCYMGLNAREGAVGVGHATTEAVVVSSLTLLIANFFLTMFLNIFFPVG